MLAKAVASESGEQAIQVYCVLSIRLLMQQHVHREAGLLDMFFRLLRHASAFRVSGGAIQHQNEVISCMP